MYPKKINVFLQTRDRAYARGDVGIIRSMNAELQRYGIPDDATIACPEGEAARAARAEAEAPAKGRQRKADRCEHETVEDRCEICNPELLAKR